jgi:ATP-dependent Lhr-like helicase
MEEGKRRARLVLDRYGVVFRTLLMHEGPSFQWKALFPALRLMELSGEIVGGLFWSGIPGLQFATPEALRELEAGGDEGRPWVQHAQDPTSLCGLGLEALPGLPRRAAGTWLWWKGEVLAATLAAGGKKLELGTELAASPEVSLVPWVQRMKSILLSDGNTRWTMETIDGQEASSHPSALALRNAGFRNHGDKLICWRA